MRRKVLNVLIFIFVMSIMSYNVFAEEGVTERSDIKTFIDGKAVEFEDTILIKNGRTLLPLRAILIELGVKNDNEHIVWNGEERSVTVYEGDKEIYLKIGNKSARVDGTEFELDAEPFLYSKNNRTYIPARFVAESLGMKVAWEDYTKSIYIRKESEYNKVKEILDRSVIAMDELKKYKRDKTSIEVEMDSGEEKIINKEIFAEEVDKENKINYSNYKWYLGEFQFDGQSYIINNWKYCKGASEGEWEKKSSSYNSFEELLVGTNYHNTINVRKSIYASLVIHESTTSDDDIILKGNIYPISKFQQNDKAFNSLNRENKKGFIEIHIDKETDLITKIVTQEEFVKGRQTNGIYTSKETITYVYSELNGDFQIELPETILEDLKENDIETFEEITAEEKEVVEEETVEEESTEGAEEENVAIKDEEKAFENEVEIIKELKAVVKTVAVDGMYDDPYGLKITEAALFIIFGETEKFESFKELSDEGKKKLMNELVQENYGYYLGCENVYALVVHEDKIYFELETGYGTKIVNLTLENYPEGEDVEIVEQN